MNSIIDNHVFSIIAVVIIIVFLLYRQIRPKQLSLISLVLIPFIIFYFLLQSLPAFHPTQTKILEISISTIVSTVLGLLACRQLHVYAGPSGKAMAKGSWTYFLWWLGAFIIKSVLSVLFGETSITTVSQLEILIPVFILITARNVYLFWRVKQLHLHFH